MKLLLIEFIHRRTLIALCNVSFTLEHHSLAYIALNPLRQLFLAATVRTSNPTVSGLILYPLIIAHEPKKLLLN
jgi:hypothetical protein